MSSQPTLSYVRSEMLSPQRPPVSQIGAAKWVRENLFDGWLSTILTIVSAAIIVWLTAKIWPWLANSVWSAGSLAECRQMVAAAGGETGACWAVIRVNLNQMIYGFYPAHLYWRPNLAFLLLCVAMAPVLFPAVPRKLLWFSVAFPFIGFWLIWGGSLWVPMMVVVGLGLAIFAVMAASASGALAAAASGILIAWMIFGDPISFLLDILGLVMGLPTMQPGLGWLFGILPYPTLAITAVALDPVIGGGAVRDILPVFGPVVQELDRLVPVALQPVPSREFGGFLVSLVIGVTAISMSLPLGIVLALGRRSDMPLIKGVCVVFIEFVRGVPLITLLFTASLLLNYFMPPGTNFDLIMRVIIMTTLFASAYMAEVIRGGLAALPRGQYEAADSLGLGYWQAQRLIIMPQALKISIPGIVNTFIGLFKDTTLVSFVGIFDPIGRAGAIRATSDWQGVYWELYIFIGAVFFIFCFGMSRYSMYLERRLRTDHR
jgi:general L-amino acid transport system permease protein